MIPKFFQCLEKILAASQMDKDPLSKQPRPRLSCDPTRCQNLGRLGGQRTYPLPPFHFLLATSPTTKHCVFSNDIEFRNFLPLQLSQHPRNFTARFKAIVRPFHAACLSKSTLRQYASSWERGSSPTRQFSNLYLSRSIRILVNRKSSPGIIRQS